MRNILRTVVPVLFLLGFTTVDAQSGPGCPQVVTTPQAFVPCGQTCTNLTASALGGGSSTSYAVNQIAYNPPFPFNSGNAVLVHTDDVWSSVIPLGFNFCFYGNTFSSAIIGSNGCLSFNTSNSGATNNWQIPAGGAPFTVWNDMFNSIMAPWQDLDPTNAGNIYYNVGGTAPCRYLEVAWNQCPMNGDPNSVSPTEFCTNDEQQTQMAVIYETSNAIEIYIKNKDVPCDNNGAGYWNNGWAIEGIMNGNGTLATTVPGRNASQWPTTIALTNDAWRFTPNGLPLIYTITWFQGTTQIGTGSPLNVCPTGPTNYSVVAKYTNCDGATVSDTAAVFVGLAHLTVADSVVQPTCAGNNGSVYATFSSSSGIISYGWAPGGAGQTSLTNLGAGTYIFSVSDSLGCFKSDTAVLTAGGSLSVSVANDTATSCTGITNNGTLTAAVTGGTGPYSYLWSPGGATTNPVTGLNVGTYSVTATDHNGCTGTASASVSVRTSALAFASPQVTNVRCFGTSTGEIIDPVNGGSNPITYTWSSGTGRSDTLANVPAGTYTVTAVDANNCSVTASFTITQPASGVSVTLANDTVISCTGATNIGTLSAPASGGTPGYSYLWSNGATTDTISGLSTGNYTVTVADASGCTATASGSVVVKSSSLGITGRVLNPLCAGVKGEIIVTVTGGVQPISYTWSGGPPSTTDTLSGVGGGVYTVTAVDANGCSVSASFTVNQPSPLSISVPNDTVSGCNGLTTAGTLTATTTGGTPGYTYLWSGSLTGNPITGLSAGTYQVTSTDAAGCSVTGSGTVVIIANPVVLNTPQITNASCAGTSTGEIILSTSGGTPPITFTWSGGTTQNDTLRNLAGGTYNITATDANGCSSTASYTVTQPSPIVFGIPTITNIGCTGGAGGSILVNANGGTGTITYKWSNGLTTNPITGLTAGGYIVTATDGNGCTATAAYTVSQSAPIAIGPATIVGISCSGTTGAIFDTATGGTGTLTYAWSGGLTGASITNLAGGGYTLTVTDANGCSATAYYIVGHDSCGACPQVNINNNVAIPCSQTCTNLIASVFSARQTTSYTVAQITYAPPFAFNTGTPIIVHTDDNWSQVVTIPFNFCFWGTAYNKIVVGTNGEISFDPGNALGVDNYAISPAYGGQGPIPFGNPNLETDQWNTIMCPWQDIDLTYHGQCFYNITGTAPCRKFEVAWYDAPMFGDSGSVDKNYCDSMDNQTQMVVLYETTNDIDIYIQNKDVVCNNSIHDPSQAYWNGGDAIEGIVNNNGTQALAVPGRNATQWTAHNDAWRFSPAGNTNYTLAWYQNGTVVGTSDTLHVCPNVATTYSVFATYTNCDASQVIVADSVYVTPGGSLTVNIDSTHNILCNNDSSGAVYASYSDTNSTITSFGWTPGGANQTSLVNIPAGTYIFTVTTASGCTKSDTVVLVNPAAVTATVPNDTFTSCVANNLGTLTVTGGGGIPGYTYLWSNSNTTATISGQTPGTYTVTVTDSHGCTASATATIVKLPGSLAFTTPIVKNPVCTSNGSITDSISGGTPPITYTWSPFEPNSGTITGLGGGTYALTVTDAGGCSVTASFTLSPPNPVIIDSTNLVNLGCHTSDNGSITVYTSGGTGTLNYTWAGGGGIFPDTNSIGNLVAGNYSVTITDSVGCSVSATYTLAAPSPIAAQSVTIVNVTCQAQGSITVIDTGGTPPLNYLWSPVGQIVDSITNQPTGTYTLTVTDAAGCSITASYTIGTAPGGVHFGAPVIVNTSCNGDSTGSITVVATGGQGTITYIWSTSATTATITGLGAGTYTVTASDTTGCSASASYTITQPAAVTFGVPTITNVSCFGSSTGSIGASASGGTGTITYLWSNGSTTATVTGLALGNYCVTASDSSGCSASVCYNITQPTQIIVDTTSATPVTCTSAGQVSVTVSGGTPGYTYLWSNGQTSNPVNVTQAGTIGVTITDANGCSVIDSVVETAGAGAVRIDSADITGVTCNGGNNGSITVYASTDSTGGPITFKWSTTATTATITGLSGGVTYTVTATDSAGCSAPDSYTVPQPNAITFNAPVMVQPTCNGGTNGSITVSASGGTGTITYVWGGGLTGPKDSLLAQGTYTVTATDSLGCSAGMTYTLTQPAAITFNAPVIDSIKCNGGTGGITVNATGGTGTITYTWTGGATGATITGLSAGPYSVTATDSVGCSASTTYALTQPTQLVIDSGHVTNATCSKNGSVVVTVSGGTTGYTYSWTGGVSSTDSLGGLTGGPVTVTVTDFNGCTATATYTVAPAVNTVLIDTGIVTNEKCNGASTGSVVVTASGGVGSLTYHWGTNPSVTDSIKNVAAGTYAITVTDSLGCTATASYNVSQPGAIVISNVDSSQVTCTSLGSLWVIASGGTGSYTYTWQGSAVTSDTLSGLAAGNYNVTVTDSNGCTVSATGIVTTAPNSINLSDSIIVEPKCYGFSNGSVTVIPTGGSGGYTYLWGNGNTTNSITVASGTYCVTVHDSNGCSKSQCDSVGQPPLLIITSFVTVNATCNLTGSAQVIAGGGTPVYTYLWSPGGSTSNPLTGLNGGAIVNVTVTDANLCTVSGADTLAPAPAPLTIADSTITPNLCNDGTKGVIYITVVGGPTGEVTNYHWSPNAGTTDSIFGLAAGTYYLIASDAGGCTLVDSFKITQPVAYVVNVSGQPLVCPGTCDAISVSVTPANAFTYAWSNGATTQTASYCNLTTTVTVAGVTVTDNNQCTASGVDSIAAAPQIEIAPVVTNTPCSSGGAGNFAANGSGGSPGGLTYTYNPGNVSNSTGVFNNLSAGSYTYTVTDGLGCSVDSSFTILPQPPGDTAAALSDSTSCYGFSDGKIIATVLTDSSLNAPYMYAITGRANQSSNVFDSLAAGDYVVLVTNKYGCTDTLLDTVGQPRQQTVSFSPDTIIGVANYATPLSPSINNFTNPVYSWTPSTGLSCTNCADPSATVATPTLYYLTVSDSTNSKCAVTDSLWFLLKGPLVMPNAFSPNGDGKNDLFGPVSHTYVVIKEFRIYNRWGQLVHNSTDYWDGKFDGKEQPAGTFIYYIEGTYLDPSTNTIQTGKEEGAVTLLR